MAGIQVISRISLLLDDKSTLSAVTKMNILGQGNKLKHFGQRPAPLKSLLTIRKSV
jgi:hypothetical protein